MNSRKSCNAFTLIELAIVLVIIGLITGGVLVGRDMIRTQQLRNIASDTERFETAVYTFRLKYNCLPGDCPNATQFWSEDAACPNTPANTMPKTATCNGNGDHRIGTAVASTCATGNVYERFRFWQHLANAGVIPGLYTGVAGALSDKHYIRDVNAPGPDAISSAGYNFLLYNCPGGNSGFFPMDESHLFTVAAPKASNGQLQIPVFTPAEVLYLDNKFDDSMPATGKYRGRPSTTGGDFDCTTTAVISTSRYKIASDAIGCDLHILTDLGV